MYSAILDVYNRGGASSLGTVLQVGHSRYKQLTIDRIATKRAGGSGLRWLYSLCRRAAQVPTQGQSHYRRASHLP